MDSAIYIAANGTEQIMRAQIVNMHNLANANTVGFRADLADMVSEQIAGDGDASRALAKAAPNRSIFTTGAIEQTNNALDIAITGDGWIAVQDNEGKEAYTRAGNMHLTAEGMLVTGDEHPVLGNGGPIVLPPAEKVEIGTDGTISIVPAGQGAETLSQINRIKLVNPDKTEILKNADGLFHQPDGQPVNVDPNVRIATGALEGSNVDTVGTLVAMMDLSRQYEVQIKMMKAIETAADHSVELMDLT